MGLAKSLLKKSKSLAVTDDKPKFNTFDFKVQFLAGELVPTVPCVNIPLQVKCLQKVNHCIFPHLGTPQYVLEAHSSYYSMNVQGGELKLCDYLEQCGSD